jgi:hypothetical protein
MGFQGGGLKRFGQAVKAGLLDGVGHGNLGYFSPAPNMGNWMRKRHLFMKMPLWIQGW